MRFFLLGLALPLASCGFDCSFPDYETVEGVAALRAEPTPSDTLTVVFDLREFDVPNVWVNLEAETPQVSDSDETELFVRVEFGDYEAVRVPFFAAEARGDSVFVSSGTFADLLASAPGCARREGVVQPVCSPIPQQLDVFVLGITTPATVRAVRYVSRDGSGRLVPLRNTPPRSAQTARA